MSARSFLRGVVAALARDTPAFGGKQPPFPSASLRYTALRHRALAVADRYGLGPEGGFFLPKPSEHLEPADRQLREALTELNAYDLATPMPYRIHGLIAFKRTNAGNALLAEWDAAHPDSKDGG